MATIIIVAAEIALFFLGGEVLIGLLRQPGGPVAAPEVYYALAYGAITGLTIVSTVYCLEN